MNDGPHILSYETFYRGHLFRSRNEATWAAFFDQLAWPWIYEPYPLVGWLPDFLMAGVVNILIDAKPITELSDLVCKQLDRAVPTKEREGWEFGNPTKLIVGVGPFVSQYGKLTLGWYNDGHGGWSDAIFTREKKMLDWCSRVHSYRGRVFGEYDGCGNLSVEDDEKVMHAWGHAKRLVRYNPPE